MTSLHQAVGAGNPQETNVLKKRDIALAVNAFLSADAPARAGNVGAVREREQHVRRIQQRYWPVVEEVLWAASMRRRGSLELTDEERLFVDLGIVDARMVDDPAESARTLRQLSAEVRTQGGVSGCYYFSEWLAHRQQQAQLESELDHVAGADETLYAGQLNEARRRVLSRLSQYLSGLPGVPLEMAEMMRAGTLDKAVVASGIAALRTPSRRNFLRRHRLWALREQILSKARARVENRGVLRLFEMLGEVYVREWRSRHDSFVRGDAVDGEAEEETPGRRLGDTQLLAAIAPEHDVVLREARRVRMRVRLLEAIDGREESETILYGDGPRLTKPVLGEFLALAQAFDRSLTELPAVVMVPGRGRGLFAWESGCLHLALRPLVGADDSAATALAWMRVLQDRFHGGGALRRAYEEAFPGANYPADFCADYRAWLCRLTRGDAGALSPDRRNFFRERIGPDLSGPLLPPNLRNVGPQTMTAIVRRLERQLAGDDGDVNLHRRLAVIYWQQGEMEAAGQQFNAAMRLDPEDGETLFTAGLFLRARGELEAAADCFRSGSEQAGDTMWGVYCHDATEGFF